MVLLIKGKHRYLWLAVDQNGNVLDIAMPSRRNPHATKRFFRQLLKGLRYAPRVLITDTLKSYAFTLHAGLIRPILQFTTGSLYPRVVPVSQSNLTAGDSLRVFPTKMRSLHNVQLRVLVVDDNVDAAEMLIISLETLHVSADCADNGCEVLSKASEFRSQYRFR